MTGSLAPDALAKIPVAEVKPAEKMVPWSVAEEACHRRDLWWLSNLDRELRRCERCAAGHYVNQPRRETPMPRDTEDRLAELITWGLVGHPPAVIDAIARGLDASRRTRTLPSRKSVRLIALVRLEQLLDAALDAVLESERLRLEVA